MNNQLKTLTYDESLFTIPDSICHKLYEINYKKFISHKKIIRTIRY